MIEHELMPDEGILVVKPINALKAEDFARLRADVDAFLATRSSLKGVMICARAFPGWKDVGALLAHLKFVRDHHRRVARVAVVSDGGVLSILPHFAEHFVAARVKHFDYEDMPAALTWLRGDVSADSASDDARTR